MNSETFDFLRALEETPSVSGSEQPVARLIRKRMKEFADEITTDVHGNLIVVLNPRATPRVMLAGHMDQIGMMVRFVSDEGFLYFGNVGGIDATVLPGSDVTVHSAKGPVQGVIGRKPVHLMKPDEKGSNKVDANDLWIDIGAKNKVEALERIAIGDSVTYRLGVTRIGDDFISSPGLDDKVGAFVVMEALRLASENRKLRCGLYAVATVQEEVGLRGAHTSTFGIDPAVGIAVDVTHATDNPGAEKKLVGDCSLGKGPVVRIGPNINPPLSELLLDTAKKGKIPHQIMAQPSPTGTDASAMQLSRAGIAAGLIGIPNRYMHTQVEMVSVADLENSARLLAETVARIDAKMSFIPM